MGQPITETIGVDLGDKYSVWCAVDQASAMAAVSRMTQIRLWAQVVVSFRGETMRCPPSKPTPEALRARFLRGTESPAASP